MSDTKRIVRADLDEIVEAVVGEFKQKGVVMATWLDYGGDDIHLESDTPFGTDTLRTALDRFVVEEGNECIIHSTDFHGVCFKCGKDTTPKKGGEDEACRHEWKADDKSDIPFDMICKKCGKPYTTSAEKGGDEQELIICGNCYCKHSNTAYDGYCSQSCFDGISSIKKGGDDES